MSTSALIDDPPLPTSDGALNFADHSCDRLHGQWLALSGLGGFISAWTLGNAFHLENKCAILLLFIFLTALPMVILSIWGNRTYLRKTSGLLSSSSPVNLQRCRIKFIGFMGTLLLWAGCYVFLTEYSKNFYQIVWQAAIWLALPITLLAFPYIVWVDRRMENPHDGYYNVGLLFLGRWKEIDRAILNEYGRSWLVKGFFIPFMVGTASEYLPKLLDAGIQLSAFGYLYATLIHLIYSVDVVFATIGYLLTFRITDSHIRSTEPTWLGWFSAISCYPPITTLIWSTYFSYKKNVWIDFFAPHPLLFITWGCAILLLFFIYVWATCSFGCRFSNLTNRGIVVDGPYRYLKHPAYVAKNIGWWLMGVPFLGHATGAETFRACACLAIINICYIVRAKTEENHLLRDPAYKNYSDWIARNGLVAQIRSLFKHP